MDSAGSVSRQAGDVIDVTLHDPLKPVAQADDFEALELGPDGRRTNDCIDTGRRAAADKNGQFLVMLHPPIISLTAAAARLLRSRAAAGDQRGGSHAEPG